MKLLCLAMAFAVWQAVREMTGFEVVVQNVPVTVDAGPGRAVLDQSDRFVSIRFRGSRDDIQFIRSEQVSVRLEAPGRAGRLREAVRLVPRHVKAPSRAHVVQFDPSEITVTVDREAERILPVRAVFAGELPPDILLEKSICTPAAVKVRGSEQLLSELEQLHTRPISLDGRHQPFQVYASVDSVGAAWTVSPERIAVEVVLSAQTAVRRIENCAVRPLRAADDLRAVRISPEKVTVTLRGSPRTIERINPTEVYTYIDCTGLSGPADYEIVVRADVPPGVQVETIDPAAVRVTVRNL
jgi:hypothetical protein